MSVLYPLLMFRLIVNNWKNQVALLVEKILMVTQFIQKTAKKLILRRFCCLYLRYLIVY